MKISEFIKEYTQPINVKRAVGDAGLAGMHPQNNQLDGPKLVGNSPEAAEHEDQPTMIFPLQQKLELLKKDQGLDNAFDDGEKEEPLSTKDPIDILKKMAGLSQTVNQTIGDENEDR